MFKKRIKKNLVVPIYLYQNRVFIPTVACYESGLHINVDPVYVTDLDKSEMIRAIQIVKDTGHRLIPDPKNREEFLASDEGKKDVILAVTGARSWKKLAQGGASYLIVWTETEIQLEISRLDKFGRWEFDPTKNQDFPLNTDVGEIVEVILDDYQTRFEIL